MVNLTKLSLDLANNSIGGIEVGNSWINLINLTKLSLNLANNNIANDSIIEVFESLTSLENLNTVYLDLRNGGISDVGFGEIIDDLDELNCSIVLDIRDNYDLIEAEWLLEDAELEDNI